MAQISLEQQTRRKFGQPGVDAINKYSCLLGAKIDDQFYMKETGDGRTFTFHRISNDQQVATGDGCNAVIAQDINVYFPGKGAFAIPYAPTGSPNWLLIGGGAVLVIGVLFFLIRWK